MTSLYYGTLTSIGQPSELTESVETLPLFKDRTFYSLVVVVPCILVILNYLMQSVTEMFVNLWENKVIQNSEPENLIEHYNIQLRKFETRINSKRAFTLISVIIPIIISLSLYSYQKTLTIDYPVVTSYDIRFFPLSGIVFYVTALFMSYLVLPAFYKGLRIVFLPRKLHKMFSIRAKPLHPDECGGLKSIGDICIRFDYIFLIGAVGSVLLLFLSEGLVSEIYLFTFLVYASFVTFFFFYPLWPIHNVMKAQKYELLKTLSEKLDPIYGEMTGSADISAENLEKIEKLDRIYDRASKMPVWPFNIGGLIRFLTTVLIPFLGIIANFIIF